MLPGDRIDYSPMPHRMRYFAEVLNAPRACDDVAVITGGAIHHWFVGQRPT